MKRCFAVFFFLLCSLQFLQGQQKLVVRSEDDKRRYEFSEGENIKLKLEDSGEVIKGSWQYASVNSFLLGGQEVKLTNVRWIDVSDKESGIYLLRKGQDLLILAGVGYFAISQLNSLVYYGEFAGGSRVMGVSGALVAGGLVCTALDRTLRKRKLPVGGSRFSISLIEF